MANTDAQDKSMTDGMIHAIAESSFVLLPLIVVAIVEVSRGAWTAAFLSPEWAFGAAVLAGHAAMKVTTMVAKAGHRGLTVRTAHISLILAIIIVVILVPSMVVLVLLLMRADTVSWGLGTAQVILFVLGWLAFIVSGTMSGFAESHAPHATISK